MDLPLEIVLESPELDRERNYDVKINKVTLQPEYFLYNSWYKSEVREEDSELWEERLTLSTLKYKRSLISGIELRYYRKPDVFGIGIEFLGIGDTFYTYYKSKKDAQKFYDLIDKWWTGK